MSSYNTHPTHQSHLTNVNGDHLTIHTRDIIINYHMHGPVAGASSLDRDHAGATGGGGSDALPRAAQHPNAMVSVIQPMPRSTCRATSNLTPAAQGGPGSVWGWFLSMFGLC
ncbi:hypothetical protein FIBSPDRAFT_879138 [Athelia psychrophila]|uniref:Uncharacterized protein n=1 Tax=Athelia psychrophila TaxID=1759441 RepID=A0A167UC02_9AGAM|nr:hypothetical protein FIBSPDRAFT_879138 [Fibularhizoctonia sp. CBS 109695]